jgi:hypothetical protein
MFFTSLFATRNEQISLKKSFKLKIFANIRKRFKSVFAFAQLIAMFLSVHSREKNTQKPGEICIFLHLEIAL